MWIVHMCKPLSVRKPLSVIAGKAASTKDKLKGLNKYHTSVFFSLFMKCEKKSKFYL